MTLQKKMGKASQISKKSKPSIQESYKYYLESVSIVQDLETSLLTLTVEHQFLMLQKTGLKDWSMKLMKKLKSKIYSKPRGLLNI